MRANMRDGSKKKMTGMKEWRVQVNDKLMSLKSHSSQKYGLRRLFH